MKITDIKIFLVDCYRTNWVFVRMDTDEGIQGVGRGLWSIKNMLWKGLSGICGSI